MLHGSIHNMKILYLLYIRRMLELQILFLKKTRPPQGLDLHWACEFGILDVEFVNVELWKAASQLPYGTG